MRALARPPLLTSGTAAACIRCRPAAVPAENAQAEDTLLHLYWKDRQTGTVEEVGGVPPPLSESCPARVCVRTRGQRSCLTNGQGYRQRADGAGTQDLILFPEDAKWERVTQCTTGRVYVLKFTHSDRRLFFWLQEPKTDKDDELATRVSTILSSANPASLAAGMAGTMAPERMPQTLTGGRCARAGLAPVRTARPQQPQVAARAPAGGVASMRCWGTPALGCALSGPSPSAGGTAAGHSHAPVVRGRAGDAAGNVPRAHRAECQLAAQTWDPLVHGRV